jgi:hypothetical protein
MQKKSGRNAGGINLFVIQSIRAGKLSEVIVPRFTSVCVPQFVRNR